jgi:MFS family permease
LASAGTGSSRSQSEGSAGRRRAKGGRARASRKVRGKRYGPGRDEYGIGGVGAPGAAQRRPHRCHRRSRGLLFGCDTGVIAGALLFIKGDFDLGSFAQGLVVAAVPIGAVFIVGAVASSAAPGVEVLVIARIVIGVAIGLAFDGIEGWRWMLGLGCVPALALAIGMLRMPQSPRWLVMTGDDFAARATLAKIRVDDPDTINRELEEIKESIDEMPGTWSELLQPVVKAALVVGVGLAILQQVTGINTVIYYAPTIVEFTGVNSSAGSILAAVGVGVINVAMTLVALRLLDRAGRRTLLTIGVSGMVISLFTLGAAFTGNGTSTLASVVAIGSLMVYVASLAISLGPIFWLLNAEIYPPSVRSKAAGVGTMANWAFNFIVSLTFLLLIEALGRSGAFWFYGCIGILTLGFCWKLVPETKGKHLEDIQAYFQARVDRRKVSAAP